MSSAASAIPAAAKLPAPPLADDAPPELALVTKQSSSFWTRMMGSNPEVTAEEKEMTMEELRLSARELHFDERIRTTCLVIMATAVIFGAMYQLEAIAIPFVLALALRYLLTPLIDTLSCSSCKKCFCRLPRGIAVILAFILTICVLIVLASVISESVQIFTERAPQYRARLEQLMRMAFEFFEGMQSYVEEKSSGLAAERSTGADGIDHDSQEHFQNNLEQLKKTVLGYMHELSLTNILLGLLGKAATIAEDLMYIVLFLVFMLTHSESTHDADPFKSKVERQIFVYIRGKTSISAFVAITNGTILWAIGLDLFLAFGVLAFFLNFIPNIGMFSSVLLPMPLVALDPSFTPLQVVLAFVGPALVGTFAKDVLEPVVLGQGTSLHPVSVLLAIMLFGSVWGVTGMVMAVPMTAVLRIHLEAIDHPLPRYAAEVLAGKSHHHATTPTSATPAEML